MLALLVLSSTSTVLVLPITSHGTGTLAVLALLVLASTSTILALLALASTSTVLVRPVALAGTGQALLVTVASANTGPGGCGRAGAGRAVQVRLGPRPPSLGSARFVNHECRGGRDLDSDAHQRSRPCAAVPCVYKS